MPEAVKAHRSDATKILRSVQGAGRPTEQWGWVKVNIVGEEGAGKTSITTCLQTKDGKLPKKENISTDGIAVHEVGEKRSKVRFLCYDFGGQEIFYPTHEFFLSE